MAHYLLGMYQPDGDPPPPEILDPIMRDLNALQGEMQAAGVWVFAGGLHAPSASTVLRNQGGEVVTTDGPYVEGKEHLGGFTIIDVPDLDAALDWGRRYARAVALLPIEVRPFRSSGGG
jgi:hypothetical protein